MRIFSCTTFKIYDIIQLNKLFRMNIKKMCMGDYKDTHLCFAP